MKLNSKVIIFFGCASVFSALVCFRMSRSLKNVSFCSNQVAQLTFSQNVSSHRFVCLCEEDAEHLHQRWRGCFVCWCWIEGPQSARCSLWELRALSWHRMMMCLINLRDNTGKVEPNLWFLNLVQTRISGPVFDGPFPNVLTLNRLTSSCYRWWTFWIELDNIRSKSLILRTETPVIRPVVFLCAAESFAVEIQDGLVVWACWSLSSHGVSHPFCFFCLFCE